MTDNSCSHDVSEAIRAAPGQASRQHVLLPPFHAFNAVDAVDATDEDEWEVVDHPAEDGNGVPAEVLQFICEKIAKKSGKIKAVRAMRATCKSWSVAMKPLQEALEEEEHERQLCYWAVPTPQPLAASNPDGGWVQTVRTTPASVLAVPRLVGAAVVSAAAQSRSWIREFYLTWVD
jgi:hypothetical protein